MDRKSINFCFSIVITLIAAFSSIPAQAAGMQEAPSLDMAILQAQQTAAVAIAECSRKNLQTKKEMIKPMAASPDKLDLIRNCVQDKGIPMDIVPRWLSDQALQRPDENNTNLPLYGETEVAAVQKQEEPPEERAEPEVVEQETREILPPKGIFIDRRDSKGNSSVAKPLFMPWNR